MHSNNSDPRASTWHAWFHSGRIYFSREGERYFFFALTVAMAVLGIAVRFGLLP